LTDPYFFSANDPGLLRWFLVQVKPNGSQRAQCNLSRQKVPFFCPLEPATRKVRGRFQEVWRALFPGYLFVRFNPATAPWRKINNTWGVARLVAFGDDGPKPIPDCLIAGLLARCDSSGHLLPPEMLKPGDNVRIINGPFAEFTTTIQQVSPDQRIWVLLDLMGRETTVEIGRENLQSV